MSWYAVKINQLIYQLIGHYILISEILFLIRFGLNILSGMLFLTVRKSFYSIYHT